MSGHSSAPATINPHHASVIRTVVGRMDHVPAWSLSVTDMTRRTQHALSVARLSLHRVRDHAHRAVGLLSWRWSRHLGTMTESLSELMGRSIYISYEAACQVGHLPPSIRHQQTSRRQDRQPARNDQRLARPPPCSMPQTLRHPGLPLVTTLQPLPRPSAIYHIASSACSTLISSLWSNSSSRKRSGSTISG